MVIFNCDHYGGLSQMIVLRYKLHKSEKTILLISQDESKTDIYRALEDKKIFDQVIPYKGYVGFSEPNKEKVNEAICDYFQKLFEENAIDLENTNKVYISCDTTCAFGIFVYSKRIEYSMVEMFPGQFAVPYRYTHAEKEIGASKAYGELLRKSSALIGDEKLAKEYVFVLPRQEDQDYYAQKCAIYLDFVRELSEIPNEVQEKILSVYNISRSDFHEIDTLVLTNSRGVLAATGLPEVKFPYLYQLLLDYYVTNAGNLVIKRHPNGLIHFTGKIPDIAGNLNGLFPIEFIALFRDVKIKKILAAGSTSIDKIRPYVDNVIAAGMKYYSNQHFLMLHQLYVAYSLAGSICDQNTDFCQTISPDFLQRYLRYVFPQYNTKELNSVNPNILNGKVFTVVDCCPPTEKTDICNGLQNASKDAITVFLNRNNSFDFYDAEKPELLNQMIPVKITKTALRDYILEDLSDEYIYIFSKDSEIREKIRTFSVSKKLYYTGIEIKVVPLKDSEIDLIKMEIRLGNMRTTLKRNIHWLTEFRENRRLEDSEIDLIKLKRCVENMETSLREVDSCLTV